MPYIASPPPVQLGLQEVTLPNGQKIKVPKAFMNRIMFDLNVSRQAGENVVGTPITPQEMLGYYFGGGVRGNHGRIGAPEQTGMYTAYTGLDEFLTKLNKVYEGSGQALQYTAPYKEQQRLAEEYQKQQKLLQETGASRKISMTATGQVLSDTGQAIRRDEFQRFEPELNREERKMQQAMMEDLQQFEKIGKNTTISNVPIKVTSSHSGDIRGSMEKHLQSLGALMPQ